MTVQFNNKFTFKIIFSSIPSEKKKWTVNTKITNIYFAIPTGKITNTLCLMNLCSSFDSIELIWFFMPILTLVTKKCNKYDSWRKQFHFILFYFFNFWYSHTKCVRISSRYTKYWPHTVKRKWTSIDASYRFEKGFARF